MRRLKMYYHSMCQTSCNHLDLCILMCIYSTVKDISVNMYNTKCNYSEMVLLWLKIFVLYKIINRSECFYLPLCKNKAIVFMNDRATVLEPGHICI